MRRLAPLLLLALLAPAQAALPGPVALRVGEADGALLCDAGHPLGNACVAWSADAMGEHAMMQPSADGATIFSARGADFGPVTLSARDAATGALRWEVSFLGNATWGQMPVSLAASPDGRLVAVALGCCDAHGSVLAFDAATGEPKWRSGPFVMSRGVLAFSESGDRLFAVAPTVRALDAAGGALVWSTDVDPRVGDISLLPHNRLAAAEGTLFVGGRHVGALDEASGALLWTFDPGDAFDGYPSHLVALDAGSHGLVVSGGFSSRAAVFSLDPATGAMRWRTVVGLGGPTICAALEGGIVVTVGRVIQGVRASDGAIAYTTLPPADVPGIADCDEGYGATAARGVVAIPTGKGLSGVDAATGQTVWSIEEGAASEVVATSTGFAGASPQDGNGQHLWAVRLGAGALDAIPS